MQKSKAKRSSRWQNWLVYVLVWTLGVAGVAWLTSLLNQAIVQHFVPQTLTWDQFQVISQFLPMLLIWIVPVLVTERLLKRSMRNWLVYTLLGTLVMVLWFRWFPWDSREPLVRALSTLDWLWVPAFQMAWLWRRVKWAWLWPLSQFLISRGMGLVWNVIPVHLIPLASPLTMLVSLPYQLVWACMMYYLWTYQAKDTQKAKVSAAAADTAQSDEARIQRLQEAEEHRKPWDYGENQALRNEA